MPMLLNIMRIQFFLLILLLAGTAVCEEQDLWGETVQRVSSAVVTIHVDAARAFDTDSNSSSQATGFVVDAEQGLILTNRHVVQAGPVVAEAFFENREAVRLTPVYRDPVHDYGFFRYDPKALKYIQPQALALMPEAARVGREIRVIGNDAGEQRSILAGTLARIDRAAPHYGRGRYNDFNTFYLQAASGVSGGSSGSPVVDIDGNVLALNAGGNQRAASSFFLPLERVVHTLELIRAGQPVTRGALLCTFDYQPYDELRRLGLRPEIEEQLRNASPGIGQLVVTEVLPEGPAHGLLQSGDILIKAEDQWLNHFAKLESLLDERVGKQVELTLVRSGEVVELSVPVIDLHQVTPDRYLSFGEAVVNDLSYQQARQLNKPLRGVYVAEPGYVLGSAGVPYAAVIVALNQNKVGNVDDLARELSSLMDGAQAVLRYFTFQEPNREQVAVMTMDRRWFPQEHCHRNDSSTAWSCESLPMVAPQKVTSRNAGVHFENHHDPRASRLMPSLVHIGFDVPYRIDGVAGTHFQGAGLIVDAERGLVVTDRNTVPVTMGDVRLTIAGTLEIPAQVRFVHPVHNLAFVQYDPALLAGVPVRSAELRSDPIEAGDPIWLVGLKENQHLEVHASQVAGIDALDIPLSYVPMFREANLESIKLSNPPSNLGGVLTDEEGRVSALWASFAYGQGHNLTQFNSGIPMELVSDLLQQWRCCQRLELRALDIELDVLSLAQAAKRGLDESWLHQLQQGDTRGQALVVSRRVAGTPGETHFLEGDLLVAVDGQPVQRFRDVERLSNRPLVEVTLIRDGKEITRTVPTVLYNGRGTQHIVQWAGALLQAPYRAVSAQRGVPPQGAYVSFVWSGSPASRYGLAPMSRIIELDGQPVSDLADFLQLADLRRHQDSVRLKIVNLLGQESIITLKPDHQYWPSREILWTEAGWQRVQG